MQIDAFDIFILHRMHWLKLLCQFRSKSKKKLSQINESKTLSFKESPMYTVCSKTEESIRREDRIISNKNTTKAYLSSLVLKRTLYLNFK